MPDEAGLIDKACGGRIAALVRRGDFAGRNGDTLLVGELSGLRARRVLLVGQGTRAGLSRRLWRRAKYHLVHAKRV